MEQTQEKQERGKIIYRLPPCPSYDIEGTESWLESMVQKGLFLSEEGWIDSILRFSAGTGKKVRYRLEAAPQSTGFFSAGNEPDEEAVEIANAAGWKYLRKYGQFYVYRTEDETAPELNTDPTVQAMALNIVRKRERSSTFSFFFWILVYPALRLFGYPFMVLTVALGLPVAILSFFVVLLEVYSHIKKLRHLRRLRKKLASGEELDHHKSWEKGAAIHRTVRVLLAVCWVAWAGVLLRIWGDELIDDGKIPLEEYTGTIPCATMADMGSDFQLDTTGYGGSEIKVWSSLLTPAAVDLRQYGSVTLADGRKISGVIYIDYYETVSPWLAKELAKEHQRYDKRQRKKYYQELTLPDLGVDYQAAYMEIEPAVVLVEGNKMISVGFLQWGKSEGMSTEEWAAFFAESIKQ